MKDKIAKLKALLTEADALAAELAAAKNAPAQMIPIRHAIHTGALVHIEALEKLAANPAIDSRPSTLDKR